ncbi:4Fe-4S binding protein [Anaeromicropila populeti]|uniref:4Fe-4S binding domain-containing protein n=1 Tax=Anaeromicropila populeti TaxID=37658 RepID=A0A1I6LIN2_9FIRM|nr:4Fe-4S binding protein [Anaeromicropila populeti]SFS03367.1 4Fe-4S binding domain-containing protein [Anaeromicropila populeti]
MMKNKKTYLLTMIVTCLVIGFASYFAWKIEFFEYTSGLENITGGPISYIIALLPFLVISILSAAGITLCIYIRKYYIKKDYVAGKFCEERAGRRTGRRIGGRQADKFTLIRWVSMISSTILLIFGARMFGTWFSSIDLPVLSCAIDGEQLGESGCYYLTHLSDLFTLPWKEIIMFLLSLFGFLLLFGRIFCGFVCPMGLLQDIVHSIRQGLGIEGISLNEKLYQGLKPVKWFLVIVFLCLCFVGGNFCNFCPAVSLTPAFAGFKVSLFVSGFIMVMVIVGSFFKRRFWCTICPMGYLMGLVYKITPFRLKKDCQSCTECGACYEACPMGIKSIYTERENEDVTTTDCIMCGECIKKCPENNALSLKFAGKDLYKASRKSFMFGYKEMEKKNEHK